MPTKIGQFYWIETDPDCNQLCRKLSEYEFEFQQDVEIGSETRKASATIDLKDYTKDEQAEYLIPFGWKLETTDNQLIAEAIFETDVMEFLD